jgi:hypothetical protein
MIKPSLPALAANPASRAALLAQLSARPWALDARLVADELNAFASSTVAVSLTLNLTEGPMQQGPAAPSARPLVIGWGRSTGFCSRPSGPRCGGVPVGVAALVRGQRPFSHVGPARRKRSASFARP